ncbi:hypothetical protein [Chryseobacterium limigenitum]|uniref:Lipoprotein n=1 Tax=Chryseobacterium limigenitum TaxID=1612149 RepID=A0A1K2IXG2_9FLAO|nr:hypothetical protein [Chryseobacterium limigenitum]SFZ97101.1 hypothetical protein SAMN05216324_1403 [Chryseobacterium limigenitum]
MRKYFYLVISFFAFGCNSKSEKNTSIAPNKSAIKNEKIKPSGKEVVEKLEKLNFFNLTENDDLNDEKTELEKSYNELNFFEGALQGETLEFLDNRFYFIDSEELFEVGGLINYLKIIKPVFEKLGLKLNYSNENSFQNDKHWRHTIKLNDREYVAFNNNFGKQDWDIAYVRFLEMLNEELKIQNSEERFYPISSQNDGRIVLLTKKQFEYIKEIYPNDKEHPKELAIWKKENNLNQ